MAFKPKEKRYALLKNPTIQAVVSQLFRFENEAQAKEKLKTFETSFIISKEQERDTVRLWIKDFALTEDELKAGYKGNYALIKYRKIGDGKFTIYAEKQEIELKQHPQKVRPKQRHPDWGHPILRTIEKGKTYPTLAEAQLDLEKLHEEYAETSIPAINKLYIIIYQKTKGDKGNPVKKYVLELQALKTGEYKISAKENVKKPKPRIPSKDPNLADGLPQKAVPKPQGYFTAMVELKKKKRRSPARPTPEKKEE